MKNKVKMTKKLEEEKNKREFLEQKVTKVTKAATKKEQQQEAQRRLDAEIAHQQEEGETRALSKAMLADAAKNRPSFNTSCTKLLANFQGKCALLVVFIII